MQWNKVWTIFVNESSFNKSPKFELNHYFQGLDQNGQVWKTTLNSIFGAQI
jgi:hypothetical protein